MHKPKVKIANNAVLAMLFGVTTKTIRQWTREGLLPPPLRQGRRTLGWPVDEISEFLENQDKLAIPDCDGWPKPDEVLK